MALVVGTSPPERTRGTFLRAVLLLSGAGVLAHGITALAMPVLSRLYGPADFGLLSVLTSVLGIAGVAACLRYELAIPLPEDPDDADQLLTLSLGICTVLSVATLLIVALMPDRLTALLQQPALRPYLWLLPLGLWLTGCYSALQVWHVRHGDFRRLARTRIAQSGGSAGVQIATGWLGMGPLGLLVGQVLNTGIACVALAAPAWRAARRARWLALRRLAYEQRRFPVYSTAEALANSAAIYLPVILIAAHAGTTEAGHLAMAMFVSQAPMSLIGTSISQVFLSRAAEEYRGGHLGKFTGEVLAGLIKAGGGPLLAMGILAPPICGWAFGSGWTRTGWLVSWMTPWFLMQFLAVPVSTALHICGQQRAALMLQFAGLALRLGSVLVMAQLGLGGITETYALTGLLFYGLYLAVIMSVTGVSTQRLWRAVVQSRAILLAWVAGAALIALSAHFFFKVGGP